jgi:hypothetical protein
VHEKGVVSNNADTSSDVTHASWHMEGMCEEMSQLYIVH